MERKPFKGIAPKVLDRTSYVNSCLTSTSHEGISSRGKGSLPRPCGPNKGPLDTVGAYEALFTYSTLYIICCVMYRHIYICVVYESINYESCSFGQTSFYNQVEALQSVLNVPGAAAKLRKTPADHGAIACQTVFKCPISIHVSINIYIYMCVYMYKNMCIHICIQICIYIYKCMFSLCISVHKCTYGVCRVVILGFRFFLAIFLRKNGVGFRFRA